MYNLIITALEDAWQGAPYRFDRSRVIRTFTDDDIKEKYQALDANAVTELQTFPTLFAYEAPLKADARVGFITRVGKRDDQVKIEYRFWESIPPIPASKIADLAWELDIDKWEITHTHWAVKRIDLVSVLVSSGLVTPEQAAAIPDRFARTGAPGAPRQLLVTPTVFDVFDLPREPDLVAVMMPFNAEFDPVYEAIQRACRSAKMKCLRADDTRGPSRRFSGRSRDRL